MKISSTSVLLALTTIFVAIVPNYLFSCYQRFRYPTKRMMQTTGDIVLPANNFTMDNGVYEVWYEFTTLNDSNSTNSTNSTSNSTTNATTNGTEVTNSTDTDATDDDLVTNSTDINNSTNITNATDITNSTETDATDDDLVTNSTDINNSTDTTNSTDVTNSTNSTSVDNNSTNSTDTGAVNSTNSTGSTNGTNSTNSTGTPTHVVFAIKFNNPGEFFAVGFGSTSMAGADIWAFEFEDGAVVVTDRKAYGWNEPPLDTERGGTSDVELLGYEIADTYTLVKVRRAINTGDSGDAVIQPGSNNLLWAFASSESISYHGNNRGTTTVELIQ